MSDAARIVFNLKYFPAGESSTANDFYRCAGSHNIINYLTRDSAQDNLSAEDQAVISQMVELSHAPAYDILDYATTRKGSQGGFNHEGVLDKEGTEKIKEKLATTKATIYSSVISFSQDFGKDFLTTSEEGREIIEANIGELFKGTQFDINNIDYFAAVHTNTEHHHIHFIFWEKTPTRINAKGKKCFAKKHNIPKANISMFKASILKNVSQYKATHFTLRDEVRNGVVEAIRSNYLLFEHYADLCRDIVEKGNFQYGRLTTDQQTRVSKIVKQIILGDPSCSKKYKDYKKALQDTQLDYIRMIKENAGKAIPKPIAEFYSSRIKDLDSRLANSFLKILKSYSDQAAKTKEQVGLNAVAGKKDGYMPKKKLYTKRMKSIASELMRDLIKLTETDIALAQKSKEEYQREKLEKGESLIYDEN